MSVPGRAGPMSVPRRGAPTVPASVAVVVPAPGEAVVVAVPPAPTVMPEAVVVHEDHAREARPAPPRVAPAARPPGLVDDGARRERIEVGVGLDVRRRLDHALLDGRDGRLALRRLGRRSALVVLRR